MAKAKKDPGVEQPGAFWFLDAKNQLKSEFALRIRIFGCFIVFTLQVKNGYFPRILLGNGPCAVRAGETLNHITVHDAP